MKADAGGRQDVVRGRIIKWIWYGSYSYTEITDRGRRETDGGRLLSLWNILEAIWQR